MLGLEFAVDPFGGTGTIVVPRLDLLPAGFCLWADRVWEDLCNGHNGQTAQHLRGERRHHLAVHALCL